jgi:hypothetical protein
MMNKKEVLKVAAMFGKESLFEDRPEDWEQRDRLMIGGKPVLHEMFYNLCEKTGDIHVVRFASLDGLFMESQQNHGEVVRFSGNATIQMVIPFGKSETLCVVANDETTNTYLGEYTGHHYELRYTDFGHGYIMQYLFIDRN